MNMKKMHKLIQWVSKSDLSEFTYEEDGVKIRLRKGPKDMPVRPAPGMMPPPPPKECGRGPYAPSFRDRPKRKKPARITKRSSKPEEQKGR